MAVSAAVGLGTLLAGPKIMKATGLAPDAPEVPAATPPAPPTVATPAANTDSMQAAAQQKKKTAAASGRQDTIVTGPKGLGEIGTENLGKKTLLGY